jgi:hypothetical protein
MNLKRRNVEKLPPNEKLNLYCREHMVKTEKGEGMSYIAQANLWNNWNKAINDWIQSLPLR